MKIIISLFFIVLISNNTYATYSRVQLEDIPIDRVIKNLKKQINEIDGKEPKYAKWKKPDLKMSLARLYMMAYAKKFDKVKVSRDRKNKNYFSPSLGNSRLLQVVPTSNSRKDANAKKYLEEAIKLYQELQNYKRNPTVAKLGLGWCLEQANRKKEAIKVYRELIKDFWRNTKSHGEDFFNCQILWTAPKGTFAIRYKKEGKEIQTFNLFTLRLKQLFKHVEYKNQSHANGKFPTDQEVTILHNKLDNLIKLINNKNYKLSYQRWDQFREYFYKLFDDNSRIKYSLDSFGGQAGRDFFNRWLQDELELFKLSINKPNDKKLNTPAEIQGRIEVDGQGLPNQVFFDVVEKTRMWIKRPIVQSLSKRQGKDVNITIELLSAQGKVIDTMQTKFPTVKSTDDYGDAPKNFDIEEYAKKSIFAEVAMYLKDLLDPKKDQEEIKDLKRLIWVRTKLSPMARFVTPIAIPLDSSIKAISDMIDNNKTVAFDLDGSQRKQKWNWLKPNAGWLAYRPKEFPSKIDSGLYLFGNVTFWLFWKNGYEALCSLDDNGDKKISGDELENLAIWNDKNSDGISSISEVKDIQLYEIKSLSCDYKKIKGGYESKNGIIYNNGTSKSSFDIILKRITKEEN